METKHKKFRKKNLYKIGLTVASATAVIAPIAAVISCDTDEQRVAKMGQTWSFDSHRIVQSVVANGASGINEYESKGENFFMVSLSGYGGDGYTTTQENGEMLSLVRQVKNKDDSPVYNATTGKIERVEVGRDSQARFELAKSITVTYADNTQKTYDNDALTPEEAKAWHLNFNDPRVVVPWERSINYIAPGKSEPEIADLTRENGISQIVVEFRDTKNSFWNQQTVGQSSYAIDPILDFQQGMKLALYGASQSAAAHSNVSTVTFNKILGRLNELAKGKTKDTKDVMSLITASSAPSLLDSADISYGLINKSLWDDNETNKIFDPSDPKRSKKMIWTFSNPSNDSQLRFSQEEFVNLNFFKNALFVAHSTKSVENAKNENHNFYVQGLSTLVDSKQISQNEYNQFLASPFFQSGYFEYMTSKRTGYYAGGAYYVSHSNEHELWFDQNPTYVDDRFTNQVNSKGEKTTIQRFQFKFIQETDLSKATIYSEYQQGTSATSVIEPLRATSNDFLNALANPSGAGLAFSRGYTSSKTLGGYGSLLMIPLYGGDHNEYVFFNNNYAKVMWGHTMPELRAAKDVDGEVVKNLFTGAGLVFRTSLDAAVNAYTVTKTYNTNYQDWNTWFPPEGQIGGTDYPLVYPSLGQSQPSTPEEAKQINLVKPLLSKWTAEGSDTGDPLKFNEVTREDYLTNFSSLQGANPLGPSLKNLAIVKANLKWALDKAGIPENQKVTWEFPTGNGYDGKAFYQVYNKLFEFIRSLDKRLNPVAKVEPIAVNDTSISADSYGGNGINVLVSDPDINFTLQNVLAGESEEEWRYRIYAVHSDSPSGPKGGYNASSMRYGGSVYPANTPAVPMTESFSYQQSGIYLGLSFFASDEGKSYLGAGGDSSSEGLAALQTIIDVLKARTTKFSNQIQLSDFVPDVNSKSSMADAFLNAFKNLKFDNLWKSKVYDIASHDYLGWGGLEVIKNAKVRLETIPDDKKTSDEKLQQAEIDEMENMITNKMFNNLYVDLQNVLSSKPTQNIVNLMVAYRKILPTSMNVLIGSILGDRNLINLSLAKSWFTDTTYDAGGFISLARFYVDLDKDEHGYGILPTEIY